MNTEIFSAELIRPKKPVTMSDAEVKGFKTYAFGITRQYGVEKAYIDHCLKIWPIIPFEFGGDKKYDNLILVTPDCYERLYNFAFSQSGMVREDVKKYIILLRPKSKELPGSIILAARNFKCENQ